jgi:hypothetical protein
MVCCEDHIISADWGPRRDPAASGQLNQLRTPAADLAWPPADACGQAVMSPDDLDRIDVATGSVLHTRIEADDLRGSMLLNRVDPSILSEDVVLHVGHAQAPRDFLAHRRDGLVEHAAHLDETGQQIGQTEPQYRAAAEGTAGTLPAVRSGSNQPASDRQARTW